MNLRSLRTFVTTAEAGGLGRAPRACISANRQHRDTAFCSFILIGSAAGCS